MLSGLYFVVHRLFMISHLNLTESEKWFRWSVPLRPKEKMASLTEAKASKREVEFIRKICMKQCFNNFSPNLAAWMTQRQMGARRRGGRGQSDDREVLDGVISETRAVRRAVILTISHKAILLISMEELRWNWIHLGVSLSLSFSLRWESNDPCNYYILWEDSQSSKASNLTVLHCPLHTHTPGDTNTHSECHSLE